MEESPGIGWLWPRAGYSFTPSSAPTRWTAGRFEGPSKKIREKPVSLAYHIAPFFRASNLQEILRYLKDRGEQLDSEIAAAVGMPLESVRRHVSALSARGEVMTCQSTRYSDGKKIEGLLCRIAGYIPPAAPGRKPKAQKALA